MRVEFGSIPVLVVSIGIDIIPVSFSVILKHHWNIINKWACIKIQMENEDGQVLKKDRTKSNAQTCFASKMLKIKILLKMGLPFACSVSKLQWYTTVTHPIYSYTFIHNIQQSMK